MSTAIEVVVLLPMNITTPTPDALADAAPELWQALRRYLEAHDIQLKTVAFSTARSMWIESAREAGTRAQRGGFAAAAAIFVEKLKAHSEFGAVVFPTLFVQGAIVSGRTATWDGTERDVEIDEGAWSGDFDEETPFGGAIPAASLHVAIVAANGSVVHERQSGLALLSRVRLTRRPELGTPGFEIEPVAEPFADRPALDAAIARVFAPYLTPIDPSAPRESPPQR
jgi:hypothetical protein